MVPLVIAFEKERLCATWGRMLRSSFIIFVAVIPSVTSVSDVVVFYEPLCPASYRQLIQIREIMREFGNNIFVSLVPFGHAQIFMARNNTVMYMRCHHGPDECMGHAWHACSHLFMRPQEQLRYAVCTMSKPQKFVSNLKKCTTPEKSNLLEKCATGTQGTAAVKFMAGLTFEAGAVVDPLGTRRLTGVPTLFVDGYYLNRSDRMHYPLLELICQKARHKPPQCAGPRQTKTTERKQTRKPAKLGPELVSK
ncbi:GILT-like protein 1 [Varroa jacobsoni]|uniref:GILT-like protein 1 n=1 Tax=Varroa jacobsoni TaxID=62625 RepID=UPI000BF62463|nr:GILT-like protein 1 [Varroa jacobsoni]